jgi:methionine sulfoxide reductase heme-binding subunit
MSAALAASVGPSTYWYLTRGTGTVAMLLLTASVVLGVLDVSRYSSPRWPRFVLDALHRNVSLLSLAFLLLHVITTLLDSFAPISIVAAFIPFTSSYRPFWLGLGAVSFDLMLALVITSMMRRRLGFSAWRATHWLAYACWPIALIHGLGTGSDVKSSWMLLITIGCVLAVLAAVLARTLQGWPDHTHARSAAFGATTAFSVFLALWLPTGPLGREWARRSGTPSNLLPHAAGSAAAASGTTAQTGGGR